MKKHILFCLLFLFSAAGLLAQDTFSIVALDSLTGEVGSAGGSCVDLTGLGLQPDFLSELLPGKGAINTQSYYLPENQSNARSRMQSGEPPAAIISWLVANDFQGDPSQRQYGIVGWQNGFPKAAAYTGSACLDAKFHRTGKIGRFTYSIQGNILLGVKVVDSMEAKFLREPGDLKCKLMAALQGAKMVGADSRCTSYGTSALFAFLKVSLPTDSLGSPYYRISTVVNTSQPFEPIDSIQIKFNKTLHCWPVGMDDQMSPDAAIRIYPNPAGDNFRIQLSQANAGFSCVIRNTLGQLIYEAKTQTNELSIQTNGWEQGVYFISVKQGEREVVKRVVKL